MVKNKSYSATYHVYNSALDAKSKHIETNLLLNLLQINRFNWTSQISNSKIINNANQNVTTQVYALQRSLTLNRLPEILFF